MSSVSILPGIEEDATAQCPRCGLVKCSAVVVQLAYAPRYIRFRHNSCGTEWKNYIDRRARAVSKYCKWSEHDWQKFNYCAVSCSKCGLAEPAVNIALEKQAELAALRDELESKQQELESAESERNYAQSLADDLKTGRQCPHCFKVGCHGCEAVRHE